MEIVQANSRCGSTSRGFRRARAADATITRREYNKGLPAGSNAVTCGLCRRLTRAGHLPRSWRTCGTLVLCRKCWRERFRLRTVSLKVSHPIGATWQEFETVLENVSDCLSPLILTPGTWELAATEGDGLLRVYIRLHWWRLSLSTGSLSRGQRDAFQKVAGRGALAGDLMLYTRFRRAPEGLLRGIVCTTVVWLSRDHRHGLVRHYGDRTGQPDPGIRNCDIQQVDIGNLRDAIRANWVSFPSQVPTFPGSGDADMQRRLVQLYFVSGWRCTTLATRYGVTPEQVRHILNAWKLRAANAGYLQHIFTV